MSLSRLSIGYNLAGNSMKGSTSIITRNRLTSASSSNRSIHSTSNVKQANNDDPNEGFAKPGPPPLPMKEQREFEKLVRENANKAQFKPASNPADEKHPQYCAKPKAEFEGETNPNTGEIGGPKNDPLKWEREWSYGGRATDF